MMKGKHFTVLVLSLWILISNCSSNKRAEAEQTLRETLVGEWRNVSIRVDINTIYDSDSSTVFEANEDNWEAKLGIQPIRTHFKRDGSYYSEYFNLNDSLVRKPSGLWKINSDSLIMNQLEPETAIYKSKVVIRGQLAEFTIQLDWDGDGKEDDLYFGVQRKQSVAKNDQDF